MRKVFIADSNGRVSLRKVRKSTLEKEYVSAGKHYVYRKATFNYDPMEGKFYWLGAERKNRRFGHKSEIFVRLEPAPTRKAIPATILTSSSEMAIPVKFYTFFYPAEVKEQSSPFPMLDKTFYVTMNARNWKYEHYDFGEYEEAWRVGLLSDILHIYMYNTKKNMLTQPYKMWRILLTVDKADVLLPEKRPKGEKIIGTFEELVKEIGNAFNRQLGGGE